MFSDKKLSEGQKQEITERIRMGLGVESDLNGFYSLGKRDKLVRMLSKDLRGMRLGFPYDIFERSILAICLQMAPMKRSTDMMECVMKSFGESAMAGNKKILYWPSPERIEKTSEEELRQRCNLGYRAKFLKRTAESITKGFPGVLELRNMPEGDALKRLRTLPGIGSYSAQIVSPHHGFPLDVWSSRIFYEILFGRTPKEPRKAIAEIEKEAQRRWGVYMWHVFVYVLHGLENLAKRYGITKLT